MAENGNGKRGVLIPVWAIPLIVSLIIGFGAYKVFCYRVDAAERNVLELKTNNNTEHVAIINGYTTNNQKLYDALVQLSKDVSEIKGKVDYVERSVRRNRNGNDTINP